MNELRNTISTTMIPRTGTLVVTQVISVAAIHDAFAEAAGGGRSKDDSTLLDGAGVYEVTLERRRKAPKKLEVCDWPSEAAAFVAGFKACSDARRKPRAKKAVAK